MDSRIFVFPGQIFGDDHSIQRVILGEAISYYVLIYLQNVWILENLEKDSDEIFLTADFIAEQGHHGYNPHVFVTSFDYCT